MLYWIAIDFHISRIWFAYIQSTRWKSSYLGVLIEYKGVSGTWNDIPNKSLSFAKAWTIIQGSGWNEDKWVSVTWNEIPNEKPIVCQSVDINLRIWMERQVEYFLRPGMRFHKQTYRLSKFLEPGMRSRKEAYCLPKRVDNNLGIWMVGIQGSFRNLEWDP